MRANAQPAASPAAAHKGAHYMNINMPVNNRASHGFLKIASIASVTASIGAMPSTVSSIPFAR
jgi:hypothetical protein